MNDDGKSEPSGKAAGAPACHLIGGGIASLAAAVFLVRDAGVPGEAITIYEQSDVFGGSLDGSGSPRDGYLIRGGRMFEKYFVCTFDLLGSIPSLEAPGKSVREEIDAFNREYVSYSRCRLVRAGAKVDLSKFGFGPREHFELGRLLLGSERRLADTTIEDNFGEGFFLSNFWLLCSTMFSFQPRHSAVEFRRYMRRFVHLFPGLKRLEGILRTPLNQYDSMIVPIMAWLKGRGVRFRPNCQVVDVDIAGPDDRPGIGVLHMICDGKRQSVQLSGHDRVFFTLGSMTDCSSLGSTAAPPVARPPEESGAWNLWRRLAERAPLFGRPAAFCSDVDKTKWVSFTATLKRPDFFEFMESFTGNAAGTGGLVTFTDSNWLMSVVLARQPHFHGQPDDVNVFWGYGLYPDRPGDFVGKPMPECSGRDILDELAGHLRLGDRAERLLGGAICIPCLMPFITSQFMPRMAADRPPVIPVRGSNFAVMGQFCEIPIDVVFTVEYSVRSAMTAVYSLFDVDRKVLPVRRTDRDPAVLARALKTVLKG